MTLFKEMGFESASLYLEGLMQTLIPDVAVGGSFIRWRVENLALKQHKNYETMDEIEHALAKITETRKELGKATTDAKSYLADRFIGSRR